ncbi:hypothetical protein AHAS_Ahas10G0153800 [Arachis hypogaea]
MELNHMDALLAQNKMITKQLADVTKKMEGNQVATVTTSSSAQEGVNTEEESDWEQANYIGNSPREINKIKAKIRDVTTPTIMQLTNIPHRDHINTHPTVPLNIHIKTKMALLTPPTSIHHHHPKIDSPELRLYLKAYARKSKTTECSRMKCELISKTRETQSRGWSLKWDISLSRFPSLLIASQVTQRKTREVKQRR